MNDIIKWDKLALARYIGMSFIAMGILSVYAEFGVRNRLIDWGDPLTTFNQIQTSMIFFKTGAIAFILNIALDVFLAIAFLSFFKAQKETAVLMSGLRLIYVAIKGVALVGWVMAIDTIGSGQLHEEAASIANQVMTFLKFHHFGFGMGLIFFGLHLGFLGVLMWRVREITRLLVWFMLLAGMGYFINSFNQLFFMENSFLVNGVLIVFILPMMFAELSFAIWLMKKYRNAPHTMQSSLS